MQQGAGQGSAGLIKPGQICNNFPWPSKRETALKMPQHAGCRLNSPAVF